MKSTALEFEATTNMPVVLAIAGSDSAGMAGIQQDIRTLNRMDVHTVCAITANTAQNNHGVSAIHPVAVEVITSQIEAVKDVSPSAIKIGLLGHTDHIVPVCSAIKQLNKPVIYDPVFAASSGSHFANNDFVAACKTHLLPLCHLITPNLNEAAALVGFTLQTPHDIEKAARLILNMGARAVFIKGGHQTHASNNSNSLCSDFFCDAQQCFWLSNQRLITQHSRGTGCALSSAIAGAIARGYELYDAIVIGKMAIQHGLRHAKAIAGQQGCVRVEHFPNHPDDLPLLTKHWPQHWPQNSFRACTLPMDTLPIDTHPTIQGKEKITLGIYPVVNSAQWVERLITLGIQTIQLRAKQLPGDKLENEIQKAIVIAKKHNVRLFINDYWQLAIKHNAYGVHLGQEDLDQADTTAIHNAGLRLGISTHSFYETARAHALRPSYIAIGPVFATTSKKMPWVPRGLEGLIYWQQVLTPYPLVAIGGINYARAQSIRDLGISGIAMISAITQAENPDTTTQNLLTLF